MEHILYLDGNLTDISWVIETKESAVSQKRKHVEDYKNKIRPQTNEETIGNLASLYQSFELGKEQGEDLIYFVEDDYLHFEPMLEEMIASYERISSQINKDIFMCVLK